MSGSERKPGRLGPYVDGYRARLLELGYTPLSVSSYSLVALGQLGRWMASEDLDVQQLDSGAIKAFLATRRTKDYRPAATASLVPLLDYLRGEGVTPPEPARALTPLDRLIGEYRQWLIVDRALAPATVRHRQQFARRFLAERITPEDDLGVKNLTGTAVTAFLLREWSMRRSRGRLRPTCRRAASCGRCGCWSCGASPATWPASTRVPRSRPPA